MPRKARAQKATADDAAALPDQTISQSPPPQGAEQPDIFDDVIAARNAEAAATQQSSEPTTAGQADQLPPHEGDAQTDKKWKDRVDPGPRYRHGIPLGDDRQMRFSRWDKYQQVRIEFLPLKEGVDVRPSPDDTKLMKDNGFQWRAQDKAWTKQLFTNDDKAKIAEVEREEGEEAARKLRGQIRSAADQAAQNTFVEVANRIRQRNGKESIDYQFGQEQGR